MPAGWQRRGFQEKTNADSRVRAIYSESNSATVVLPAATYSGRGLYREDS